jgi:serine phosphatase RsbU (regulator of sigma subunit)
MTSPRPNEFGAKCGLERTLALYAGAYQRSAAAELGRAIFDAVERHRRDKRLSDDLTVLVLSRLAIAG